MTPLSADRNYRDITTMAASRRRRRRRVCLMKRMMKNRVRAAGSSRCVFARRPPWKRSVTDCLAQTMSVRPSVRRAAVATATACSIIQKTPTARTPSNYSGEITSFRGEAVARAGDDAGRGQYRLGAIGAAACIRMCRTAAPVGRQRR